MKCECGFQFSGPGEFRNFQAVLMDIEGIPIWVNICPTCGKKYTHDNGVLK